MKRYLPSALTLAGLALLAAGCATTGQSGPLFDASDDVSAGEFVSGKTTGSTARGVIMGAAVGGATGTTVGFAMDQQAKELAYDLPGATVRRFSEGITVTFPDGLLFGFDSHEVTPAAREHLGILAASLKKYPDTRTLIVSHTDAKGRDGYNMGLSIRRAEAAANVISGEGVARARVGTAGRGETDPIATNGSNVGRSQNRRIEIAIYASPTSTIGAAN